MAKSSASKSTTTAPAIVMVPTNKIIFDTQNPRKEFQDESMAELVASIKKDGILSPIMIRPAKGIRTKTKGFEGEPYMVVYGARRFSAACTLDMEEVPCIVREMNDDEAFEIQITENLQRKNINVMEESDAFYELRRRGISTPEMIADKLGVSVRYVYDRLVLQNVIKEVQDRIRTGKLSISHGKQMARLPKDDQEKIWESLSEEDDIHVDEIRHEINSKFTLKLVNAPFDIKSKTLVRKAGACMQCDKRTGCRLVLFEEAEQNDICLDSACYDNKVQAHIDATIKKLKDEGKEVKLLYTGWQNKGDLVISRDTWSSWEIDDDDDEKLEPNAYGIIVEAQGSWSDYKIGQVVPLHIPDEKEVNDVAHLSHASSTKSHKNYVDHDYKFVEMLVTQVCNQHEMRSEIFPGTNIRKYFIDETSRIFYQLEDEILEIVASMLDIERVKKEGDDDQVEWCPKTSMQKHCDQISEVQLSTLHNLMTIVSRMEGCTMHMDTDDAKEINDMLQTTGLNVFGIAEQYRKDHPGTLQNLIINEPAEA